MNDTEVNKTIQQMVRYVAAEMGWTRPIYMVYDIWSTVGTFH